MFNPIIIFNGKADNLESKPTPERLEGACSFGDEHFEASGPMAEQLIQGQFNIHNREAHDGLATLVPLQPFVGIEQTSSVFHEAEV